MKGSYRTDVSPRWSRWPMHTCSLPSPAGWCGYSPAVSARLPCTVCPERSCLCSGSRTRYSSWRTPRHTQPPGTSHLQYQYPIHLIAVCYIISLALILVAKIAVPYLGRGWNLFCGCFGTNRYRKSEGYFFKGASLKTAFEPSDTIFLKFSCFKLWR